MEDSASPPSAKPDHEPSLAFSGSRDMNSPKPMPRHFYSLDALRGLAALAVVFFHWRHFHYQASGLGPFSASQQPFYRLFRPLYNEGLVAVDLFFCLSGFIFYWLYGAKVSRGSVSAKEFAILRFSRLYPLHFLTLIVVAAGQALFFSRHHWYFVYSDNDLFHFFLQLMFASNWGISNGVSFNGPTWSVSIEILLYLIFFTTCRFGLNRWWHLVLFALIGLGLVSRLNVVLGPGMFSFFMGGLSYYAVEHLQRVGVSRVKLLALVAFTLLMWPWAHKFVTPEYATKLAHVLFPGVVPTGWVASLLDELLSRVRFLSWNLLLFPLTLISLAMVECSRGTLGKRLSFLGHISYSSYLLHFPLQLGFVLIGSNLAPGGSFYETRTSLVLFFAILIPLSLTSYWYFERPAQSFLRARLLPSRGAREPEGLARSAPQAVTESP